MPTEQNDSPNQKTFEESVESVNGRLHRVRSTYDESGNLIDLLFAPLMVEYRFTDVCEMVIGASVMAIPVALTEEVWVLGTTLPWSNAIAIILVSLSVVAAFVYFVFYQGHFRGNLSKFLVRVIASYSIALLVAAVLLIMFEKFPWQTDPATAIKRMILVGFPACFSGTVVDSLK
jgi:uncharacterized membrane protein